MSSDALKSLTIEHLRGSVTPFTLDFEKGKKLILIYGENGTGKSTICDALDFLGNGCIGSLDGRGLGKTTKYWPSVGKTNADAKVTLTTASGDCSATVVGNDVIVQPCEKQPNVKVLRRKQILELIETQPGERYKAISRFIDVSGFEGSEGALRSLIKDIKRQVELALERIQENRRTIDSFWEQAGKPGSDAIAWAQDEAKKDQTKYDNIRTAIDHLADAYKALRNYPQQIDQKQNEIEQAKVKIAEKEATVAELTSKVAEEYIEVIDLLQAADKYFHTHTDPDVCPLCESAEKAAGLPQAVAEKIAAQQSATTLKQLQNQLAISQEKLERLKSELDEIKTQALEVAENFSNAASDENLPADIALPGLLCPENIDEWEGWLKDSDSLIQAWREESDKYADSKRFLGTLRDAIEALEENSQIQTDLETLLPQLEAALKIMESERKKYTDGILSQIAIEVGRLYEVVHPGEGLNKISLELDPKKRASLGISTEFQGQPDAPPQAYFSDSHLDTLGLCVFLALAQMDDPENTILVLDDVLGSVDEPHVDRLISLLYEEANKFRQCIITTHYRPWREKFRWGKLKVGECQFVELDKWAHTSGIRLRNSIPEIVRLRALLEEPTPDPQVVCAKAGVILEAGLDFLTVLYECKLPRKASGPYTLGDLLSAIDKKLKAALRVEQKTGNDDGSVEYIERQLAPHLEELARIAQARNVFGCHFNTLSFDLLDTEAIAFGQEVLTLMECLIDEDAGWPNRDNSGSYWANKGETRRLHPLRRPR